MLGQQGIDPAGGFFAFGHGVDHFASAIGAVTADEKFRNAGRHGLGIVFDASFAVEFEAGEEFFEGAGLLFLSDGFEHEVEFLGPFAAGDNLHFAVAGFGLGQAEGFDVSVFGEHFGRDGVEVESGAVVFGQFVFEAVGGHVVLASAVNDGGDFGPEAFGLADGVDGSVAAAEDGDAAADGDFVERFGVDPLDEFEGVNHFGEIFAGNTEAVGPAEAEGEEDGVVVFFEFGHGEVLADFHAVLKFHTEALDHFDFVETDLGRHFVVGDAVGVEAAAFFLFVEDGGIVA